MVFARTAASLRSFNGNMLEVAGVSKSFFSRKVLDNVSFSLPPATILGLLGPNGAGKTTLVRCCLGIYPVEEGAISIAGHPLFVHSAYRLRSITGLQSDGEAYGDLSVKENLFIWGRIYGMRSRDIRSRISQLTERFELAERLNTRYAGLSRGNRQKVLLMRAFLHRPALLFLDEPTTSLDPIMIKTLQNEIRELVKQEGSSVILSTHHLDGDGSLFNNILFIDNGQIILSGTLENILRQHWPQSTYDFVTSTPQLFIQASRKSQWATITSCKKETSQPTLFPSPSTELTHISLRLKRDITIEEFLQYLINNDVKIEGFSRSHHTLKELYFDYFGNKVTEGS